MPILDTCAFIWLGLQDDKLTEPARRAIATGDLGISTITFLELGYLKRKGRIQIACSIRDFARLVIDVHHIETLPISPEIVETALALPDHINNDPADRLISATAITRKTHLVTADSNLIAAPEIPTTW